MLQNEQNQQIMQNGTNSMKSPDSYFSIDNLFTLKFTNVKQMDYSLKQKADLEGFTLSRHSSEEAQTITYYCSKGTKQKSSKTGSVGCDFTFSFTKKPAQNPQSPYIYVFSTKAKSCLVHNHRLLINHAKIIDENSKIQIQETRKLPNSNNSVTKAAYEKLSGIYLSSQEFKKIIGSTKRLTKEEQLHDFELYKTEKNESQFYEQITDSNHKLIGIISMFSETNRPFEDTQLIIIDETKFTNMFGWGICPITSLTYNYGNEIIGYIMADSFNKYLYQKCLNLLENKFKLNILTVCTDNTLAAKAAINEEKYSHIICSWHHMEKVKAENPEYQSQLIETYYKITHDFNQQYVNYLRENVYNSLVSKNEQDFMQEYFPMMTQAFGARPNFGVVVSSRSESSNSLIKATKPNMSQLTLVSIEKHIKNCNKTQLLNSKYKSHSELHLNYKIAIDLGSIFQPNIVTKITNQIVEANKLIIFSSENINTNGFSNPLSFVDLRKEKEISLLHFPYIVGMKGENVSCDCQMMDAMHIPCAHIFRYCAEMNVTFDFSRCSYWLENKNIDQKWKHFSITLDDIKQITMLNGASSLNRKNKQLGAKSSLIETTAENKAGIDEEIDKLTHYKFWKNKLSYELLTKILKTCHTNLIEQNPTIQSRNQSFKQVEQLFIPSWKDDKDITVRQTNVLLNQLKYHAYNHSNGSKIIKSTLNSLQNEIDEMNKAETKNKNESKKIQKKETHKAKINRAKSTIQMDEISIIDSLLADETKFANLREEQRYHIRSFMNNLKALEIWYNNAKQSFEKPKSGLSMKEKDSFKKMFEKKYNETKERIMIELNKYLNSSG